MYVRSVRRAYGCPEADGSATNKDFGRVQVPLYEVKETLQLRKVLLGKTQDTLTGCHPYYVTFIRDVWM